MKTRTDFVSNSSSCSFVINDVKKAVECLKSTFADVSVPIEIDSLSLRIYAVRSVLKEIIDALDITTSCYDNFTLNHLPDDEDSYDFCFSLLQYIPTALLLKIHSVCITCDNYAHEDVLYLSVLYLFFKNEGVDVDCDDSEMPLMFQGDNATFIEKILRKAFKED